VTDKNMESKLRITKKQWSIST